MFFLGVVLDSLRACQTNDADAIEWPEPIALASCRLRHCTPGRDPIVTAPPVKASISFMIA